MSAFVPVVPVLAATSGVGAFFVGLMILAVVAGIAIYFFAPTPFKGFGIGLIAGAVIIAAIVMTGPKFR